MFAAIIGVWAFIIRFRSRALDGAWYGSAIVLEGLIVVQVIIGITMYLQGQHVNLPRPFIHVLYGVVAVITLPGAYAYLGNAEDEGAKTVLMALVCLFLWAILQRAATVTQGMPVA